MELTKEETGLLFGTQANDTDPSHAIRFTRYDQLVPMVHAWSKNSAGGLIIRGTPGIGKSKTVQNAVKNVPHLYMKDYGTQFGTYIQLYKNKDLPVVFDDMDSFVRSPESTALFKALTESEDVHTLQRTSAATLRDDSEIPPSFGTRSSPCMLVNAPLPDTYDWKAIADRCTYILFRPTIDEILKNARSWYFAPGSRTAEHKDVFDYVSGLFPFTPIPSFRFYDKAIKYKLIGQPWRELIKDTMLSDKRLLTAIELSEKKMTGDERESAWKSATGQGIQVYYDMLKVWRKHHGIESTRSKAISEGMKRKHAARKSAAATGHAQAPTVVPVDFAPPQLVKVEPTTTPNAPDAPQAVATATPEPAKRRKARKPSEAMKRVLNAAYGKAGGT